VGGPGGREGSREVFFHHTYSRITIKARNTVHKSIIPGYDLYGDTFMLIYNINIGRKVNELTKN
jgi:predicted transcriptional regulator